MAVMNAINVYEDASRKLELGKITLGEFEGMVAPLQNVITIQEKTTNGQIMVTIFGMDVISEFGDYVTVIVDGADSCWHFSRKWWNAPYKGSEG